MRTLMMKLMKMSCTSLTKLVMMKTNDVSVHLGANLYHIYILVSFQTHAYVIIFHQD